MNESHNGATSAAELFDLLWVTLVDVLGTAATAIILRRAIREASLRAASVDQVSVVRNGLEYEYRVPETWKQPGNDQAVDGLRVVAAALSQLLVELTGPVVVNRLSGLTIFRKWGIQFSDEGING